MQTISLADLARQEDIEPTTLATRFYGKRLATAILNVLDSVTDEGAILLSFRDIRFLDGSFADEAFGLIAASRSRRQGPRGVLVLKDLDEGIRENIHMALVYREDIEQGLRNCVLPMIEGTQAKLIGKAEDHVIETFDLLVRRKHLTARELASAIGRDISATSTRLKVLFDLGLATRSEGNEDTGSGKHYVYHWPI